MKDKKGGEANGERGPHTTMQVCHLRMRERGRRTKQEESQFGGSCKII